MKIHANNLRKTWYQSYSSTSGGQKQGVYLPNYYDANQTLILNTDKNLIRKTNYKPIAFKNLRLQTKICLLNKN